MRRIKLECVAACALFCAALAAHAATLVVDPSGGTPYTTIQPAIDDAVAGDEVFVRCGEYSGPVLMKNGVDLRGAGAHCTVIDGELKGSVVLMPTIDLPTTLTDDEWQTLMDRIRKPGA